MIRGNEPAIDLGLELLSALKPNCALTTDEITAHIDAAREVLGLQTKPFQRQDLWFLEHRALRKMRALMHRQKIKNSRQYLYGIIQE